MKEYKVELKLIMDYDGTSKADIFKMVNEEFGLGDKQFELDIDGKSVYDYEDAISEDNKSANEVRE